MKLIFSAGSLYTLPEPKILELARDTGFDGIEIIINHDYAFRDNIAFLREVQQVIPVLSIHAPFFDIDGWGNKIDQLHRCTELALETGIPLINFHPPAWVNFEFKFWRYLKGINDFQEELGQNQVLITLENMPCFPKSKINPYLLAAPEKMIEFMDDHNLYLTFDTAHMGSINPNFLQNFHKFYDSGRMRNIHFSDYANGKEHLLPGHGALPLTRFLNHLRETHYDEALVLELSPHEFPPGEEMIRETLDEIFAYLCAETRHVDPVSKPGMANLTT